MPSKKEIKTFQEKFELILSKVIIEYGFEPVKGKNTIYIQDEGLTTYITLELKFAQYADKVNIHIDCKEELFNFGEIEKTMYEIYFSDNKELSDFMQQLENILKIAQPRLRLRHLGYHETWRETDEEIEESSDPEA